MRLAKRELVPRMQQRVDELTAQGVELIVPLCASNWSDLRCSVPFINPGAALHPIIYAMLRPGGTLGMISPTAAQAELARARAAKSPAPIVSTHAQPYADEAEQQRQSAAAGALLREAGVDLIYMGCMGHTRAMRATVREASGKPTLTANSIIAGLIAQAVA